MTHTPKISIITVVYNGEKFLEETIQSVLNQSYKNIEYIIIDGGSTDGTVEIIKKYEEKLHYWVSEADNGIYDAMNKGIGLCNGELIGIINADDWYLPKSIEKVVEVYKESNTDEVLIHGILDVYDKNENYVHSRGGRDIPIMRWMSTPFKHPTCFVSSKVYKKIGLFDTQYRLAADYDFMLRVIKYNIKRVFVKESLTALRQVGVTSGSSGVSAQDEILDILRKNITPKVLANIFLWYRLVRKKI